VIEEEGGERYRVTPGAMRGRVRVREHHWGGTRLRGWAADGHDRPAAALAMFLDGRYVGYGGCGVSERSRAEQPAAPAYAVFKLRLPVTCPTPTSRLRVFALAEDGCASELRHGGRRAGGGER
jgi:hypothetical protein